MVENLNVFLKNRFVSLSILLIILAGISFLSYSRVSMKEGYFLDEVYSFYTANGHFLDKQDVFSAIHGSGLESYVENLIESVKTGGFSRSEFLKNCYVSSNGFDYFNAYCIQMGDVHPPLYYLVLHSVSSLTKSSNLNLIGFSVNIIFLILTCVLIYKIIDEILKDKWVALIGVAYYGFSYEFANNAAYFRMYCMCAFWFVLLLYLYVELYKKRWVLDSKLLISICVVQYLSVFTQYFSVLYILPLFSLTTYYIKGNRLLLKRYLIANSVSALIYFVTWPCFIFQIMSGASQKSGVALITVLSRFVGYARHLVTSLFACNVAYFLLFAFFIFGTFCYCFIKYRWIEKIKESRCSEYYECSLLLIFPVLFYYIVIALISPWVDIRYQSPVMPIVSILIVVAFYWLLSKISSPNIAYIVLSFFVIVLSLTWNSNQLSHLYQETPKRKAFYDVNSQIEAIILDDDETDLFIDIPLNCPHAYYYHTDDRHACDFLTEKLSSVKYTLYVNRETNISVIDNLLKDKGYEVEPEDLNLLFWHVYSLKKN